MLGNSVLVPGNKAYPDNEGSVHGVIDLPVASGITNIAFKSRNGDVLHFEELGAQPSGLTGFSWENIPKEIIAENEYVIVEAYADQGDGLEGVTASVFGEVLAASTSPNDGVMLNVKGYGEINVNEVVRFRQN